jgi:hypothetical protein
VNKKILRQAIFNSDFSGHGGEKRTAQISDLLRINNIEYILVPGLIKQKLSFRLLKNLILSFKLNIQILFRLKTLGAILNFGRRIYHSALIINSIKELSPSTLPVFLWEGTKTQNYIYPVYFKSLKYKIIGIPHNLESLVPGQLSEITNRKSPSWFLEEIEMLRICDMVFTISREENLLLKQFGIDSQYLPYFPAGEVYNRLLEIRNTRNSMKEINSVKLLLLLGSIINMPTRLGMINRINWFINSKFENFKLGIAGYSTDELKDNLTDSVNIVLYGSLSNDRLYEILSEVDAVLIHQVASSGALTRIPEMLIAGIPVFINTESARSYYNIEGLNVYENDIELNRYLSNEKVFHVPPLPQNPQSFIINFLKQIY